MAALCRSVSSASTPMFRSISTKVAVLGAAGGIGQPLSLLLKMNPRVDHLSCFDVFNSLGVAADLNHCDTGASVSGHVGEEELGAALEGCTNVVIPAGVPRKPGMTRDDLFGVNASIVAGLARGVAKYCPDAFVSIISNPVNSTVPIFKAVLQQEGCYNPKRLAGVTMLDVLRARVFVAENQGFDPTATDVTVIGGHAGITILPLLSQIKGARISPEDRDAMIKRVQFGGDEVNAEKAKGSGGSATLSMALAAANFTDGVLAAEAGESVTMCAYVESNLVPGCDFFASPVKFGLNGIEEVLPFGDLDATEQGWFDKLVPDLKKQIAKGEDFVASS